MHTLHAAPIGNCHACRRHALVTGKEGTKPFHGFDQHGWADGIDSDTPTKIARSCTHEPLCLQVSGRAPCRVQPARPTPRKAKPPFEMGYEDWGESANGFQPQLDGGRWESVLWEVSRNSVPWPGRLSRLACGRHSSNTKQILHP